MVSKIQIIFDIIDGVQKYKQLQILHGWCPKIQKFLDNIGWCPKIQKILYSMDAGRCPKIQTILYNMDGVQKNQKSFITWTVSKNTKNP